MAEDEPPTRRDITSAQASEAIKRFAERRRFRVEISEEQLEALVNQWDDTEPREPAELTFFVGDRDVMQLRIAGYRYRGDTCCV